MSAPSTARSALELLVPGLFAGAGLSPTRRRLPALELLLTRADEQPLPDSSNYARLACERLGLELAENADVPFAACSVLATTGQRAGYHLHLTPVSLAIDRTRAHVLRPDELDLDDDELDALFDTVAGHLREQGVTLSNEFGVDWVVHDDADAELQTTMLYDTLDRDAAAGVPRGADASAWRVRLNEIQMLLHEHPVNQRREAAGQAPLNSVWPWGSGRLPPAKTIDPLHVAVDEPRLEALAQAAGHSVTRMRDYSDWLATPSDSARLLVLSRLATALRNGDAERWARHLKELEDALTVVVAGLRARRLASVIITDGCGSTYRVDSRAVRRWFGARRGRYAALVAEDR